MLVSCGDTSVRIWSLADGELLHTVQLPSWCYNFDLNYGRTLLAVADYRGGSIYNFSTRVKIMEKQLNVPNVDANFISDVRFNESGTKLIVGQHNGQLYRIDLY